jgi:restriction endonuclease
LAPIKQHFNESQANAIFRNPKRIISLALFFIAKVVVLRDDDNLSVLKK